MHAWKVWKVDEIAFIRHNNTRTLRRATVVAVNARYVTVRDDSGSELRFSLDDNRTYPKKNRDTRWGGQWIDHETPDLRQTYEKNELCYKSRCACDAIIERLRAEDLTLSDLREIDQHLTAAYAVVT